MNEEISSEESEKSQDQQAVDKPRVERRPSFTSIAGEPPPGMSRSVVAQSEVLPVAQS
jgi:hypothetical protein